MGTGLALTVYVREQDETRLETVIAAMQQATPGASEDECVDMIFRIGLEMAGTMTPEEPTL